MGTQDNGKVIPFAPRERGAADQWPHGRDGEEKSSRAPGPQAGPPAVGELRDDLALLRRRGLDRVDCAPAGPTSMAREIAPARSLPASPSSSPTGAEPPAPVAAERPTIADGSLNAARLSSLFIASLDDMIRTVPASGARQLWPNRRDPALEKVAVDIVDMLFGFVVNDPQVPRGIKESLLRAQMPVLQLAMREADFFSDWQHPARRLLNSIAPLARLFGERGGDMSDLEREFTVGLDRVLDQLAPNGAAFAQFHSSLAHFAGNSPVVADNGDGEAWQRAETVARAYLERPLPPLARDFLAGYWIDVLQHAAQLHAADTPQWQDTVAVIDDLAWSLTPKESEEDRLQLIGLVPALLTRLNRGLDLIDVDRQDRRPFFDALIDVHASVLRVELTPAPLPRREESASEQVGRLQRGDWVEFTHADGSVSRERLTWISPQRGILVFSNHQGQRAIQIAPDDLAELVRDNRAMLIFDQPEATSDKNSA
jgi:hypothetical protein